MLYKTKQNKTSEQKYSCLLLNYEKNNKTGQEIFEKIKIKLISSGSTESVPKENRVPRLYTQTWI